MYTLSQIVYGIFKKMLVSFSFSTILWCCQLSLQLLAWNWCWKIAKNLQHKKSPENFENTINTLAQRVDHELSIYWGFERRNLPIFPCYIILCHFRLISVELCVCKKYFGNSSTQNRIVDKTFENTIENFVNSVDDEYRIPLGWRGRFRTLLWTFWKQVNVYVGK